MNTYDSMVARLKNAWREDDDEDERKIVPDGGIVRVSLMAMDSVQRAMALDARVRDNMAANKATLATAQRNADRAQAFADHFTAEREAQADGSAYGQYCQQLADAWRQEAA